MSDPIPLDIAQALAAPGVSARLGICAGRLSYHAAVSSTNDVALELARSGGSAGTSVVASTQSAGRGRLGRNWFSPSDLGVYVSVVLDNVVSPTVTLLAGVAAAEAIRASSGVPVELEWPNDLVLSSGASTRSYHRSQAGWRVDRGGERRGRNIAGRGGDRRQCGRGRVSDFSRQADHVSGCSRSQSDHPRHPRSRDPLRPGCVAEAVHRRRRHADARAMG